MHFKKYLLFTRFALQLFNAFESLSQGSGQMSMEVQQEEVRETKSDEAVPLFPAPCPLRDRDYVCLPNRTLSRSTEDLTSHSSSGPKWYHSPEQDQQHLNATLRPVQSGSRSGFGEPAVRSQPPDYTAGPLPSWPQGGANSGYCQLPAAFTVPPKWTAACKKQNNKAGSISNWLFVSFYFIISSSSC